MGLKNPKEIMILMVVITSLFFITIILHSLSVSQRTKDYCYVKHETSFEGKIGNIDRFRGNANITLHDGSKFKLPFAENPEYLVSRLTNFVHEGDQIRKNFESDTILIIRQNNKYFFVIR